jgi:hypothetical protein
MRLIAERIGSGRWGCYAEGKPEVSASAPLPGGALQRLCAILGLPAAAYAAIHRTPERIIYDRIRRGTERPCPDCRGTGEYVGFTVVEPCRACGGSGVAAE